MSLRVLIAVTHLLGAGHLTRAAALGRAMAAAGHQVTLVSGGMPARLVSTDGLALVQLPPVRALSESFSRLGDAGGREIGPDLLAERRARLLAAFEEARPDVLVTELYPFGRRVLAAEFQALLAAARFSRPLTLCSVRDILVPPTKPGRAEEAHRVLAESYDAVLVHGDPALVPLEASWPLDAATAGKLIYTGYLDAGAESADAPLGALPGPSAPILVAGGSSEAALPLLRAAIGAARIVTDRPWHLLVGAGVAADEMAALQAGAPAHVTIEWARPDFRALLTQAAVFVGLSGYNTVLDLFAARVRSVLVPFERGRETEQRLRAERLAERGLSLLLPEAELNPAALVARVRQALAMERPSPAAIDCGGAAASVRIIEGLAERHRADMAPRQTAPAPKPALVALKLDPTLRMRIMTSLNRIADCGRTLPFWWRDDDAVAHTPALDRLLHLAERFRMPIGIAAIPGRAERSLADRLAAEPDAMVLVHGLSHANHAPDGAKKAEFGPHRPLAAMMDEAAEARRLTRALLGGKALDVFVPPWNRISPALASALPGLGYAGLSAASSRGGLPNIPGLAIVHAQLDPIDWHGGGKLVDGQALAATWERAIGHSAEIEASGAEPIGLLTHHLVMTDAVWCFCEDLLGLLREHPAVVSPELAKLWPRPSILASHGLPSGIGDGCDATRTA